VAGKVLPMRFPPFTILLAVSALACSEPSSVSPVGVWRVTVVNGLTIPAPTTTGHTFRYGTLSLADDQTGSVEYCTALPAKAGNHILRWRFLDATHLEFTYFNTSGEQPPIDSAVVIGENMTWNAKVAEPQIGSSFWRLLRTSLDPLDDNEVCM
jgi:hypothetical protein